MTELKLKERLKRMKVAALRIEIIRNLLGPLYSHCMIHTIYYKGSKYLYDSSTKRLLNGA